MNEEKRINFSNKKIIILLVLVVLLLVGATLAASVFSVFNGNYVYKTACFDITYDVGQDITGTMFPSKNDKGGLDGDVSIGIDPTCGVMAKGNLYLNVDSSTSNKFIEIVTPHCENKYTLETLSNYTTSDACNTSDNGIWVDNGIALKYSVYDNNDLNKPVSVGYVDKIGDSINIYSDFTLKESTSYTIYIWLDGELADNSYSGLSFSANVSATAEQVFKYIEEPVLDDGMIPVVISDNGVVTTISEDDLNWYDYNNKKWANMVLVNENATDSIDGSKSREYYLNNPGVTVLESDILAYYVWIPRYKYKIWTTGVSSTGNEQEIDIQFEFRNEDFSNGLNVGEYRTHPAFWFDNNNDGIIQNNEKLSGIWVGKFETTGTADKPTVLSNTKSLTGKIISSQFNTSLKFSGGVMDTITGKVTFSGNNIYGLTTDTDSHMMKNSEWGAVAYLSHSKYGINSEIRNNNYNNSGTLTGCGASTLNANESTTCGIIYGVPSNEENSYPQSTTGNISGVYDMSGGGWEYVMGNYNSTKGSSGFSVFPESKYYDKYTITAVGSCTIDSCGGHALFETEGWYSDRVTFITSSNPWFLRGGGYSASSNNPGSYAYYYESGGTTTSVRAFRSVLIPYEYIDITLDANGGGIKNFIEGEAIVYDTVGEHTFTVESSGEYKLEVWGAQGGVRVAAGSSTIGYGGYSSGMVSLTEGDILYLNVGGQGATTTSKASIVAGGYNGGGKGYSYSEDSRGGASGGGATHIATVSGTLSSLSSNTSKVLIVAGGGGGSVQCCAGYSKYPGSGGGYVGVNGTYNGTTVSGGTQSSGSSFGQGGNCSSEDCAGGGGGYYGGKSGIGGGGFGGGGSGYIGNSLLSDKAMYCYNCKTSNEANTLTYSTTNVSDTPISNYAKRGNGAASIKLLDGIKIEDSINVKKNYNEKYGDLPVPIKDGYIFIGWYTEPNGGYLITSDTYVKFKESHTLYARWEEAQKYTISYDANGGSGAPDSQIKYHGQTLTLSNIKPVRSGYNFLGWSRDQNATSATYSAGGSYNVNEAVTLYAVWAMSPVEAYSCANGSVGDNHLFTYTGNCTVIDDGDNNWRVKFLTSGTLTSTADILIDAFLVGGGGGGSCCVGPGGGGGYTTNTVVDLKANVPYEITIGNGGGAGSDGNSTIAFGAIAFGGGGATSVGGTGGSGGAGALTGEDIDYNVLIVGGGSDGSNGVVGGTGQGTTTREFGEMTGDLYAGGGGGGGNKAWAGSDGGAGGGGAGGTYNKGITGLNGAANTGGGGGGGGYESGSGGTGGSGIVVIRNARSINKLAIDFTYTGYYAYVNDGNGNWRIRFLTSGTFVPEQSMSIDAFLVGGGGGGDSVGVGGGGGYTLTSTINIESGTSYSIVVGAGGAARSNGESTSAFNLSVLGGVSGNNGGAGGSGGAGYGVGGYRETRELSTFIVTGGSNGGNGVSGGTGQGTTTREFGETSGTLYSGGGGGGGNHGYNGGGGGAGGGGKGGSYSSQTGGKGAVNTGGGGGSGGYEDGSGGKGGSGIIVIRNKR